MHKGFGSKISLLLTFFLSTSFLPASDATICPANASEKNVKIAENDHYDSNYNGSDGSDGSDGRAGRDGSAGSDQTVYADGSSVSFDLSGKNGEDGEDGDRGNRPNCNYYPLERDRYSGRDHDRNRDYSDIKRDIHAPHGGDGGRGGNGGNGGDGGSVLVYYTNIEDLKKILVRSVGGESGRGGRGATGAEGCRCRRKSWEVRECTGKPDTPNYKCTEKVYRCYDGRRGSNGSDGKNGRSGKLGTLRIVKSKEPITRDMPTINTTISQLIGKQLTLSKNKWLQRYGANSLLAYGSVMADEYFEFDRRLEGSLQLIWQEKQPITNFANQQITLNLNDSQEVEIDFPEDFWLAGNGNTQGNLTQFTVTHAILRQDVTRLAVSDFADAGETLNLKIVDLAGKSEALNTQFRIKYRARDNFADAFDYRTLYEGDIPSELVTREYNRFTLNLGKMKIPRDALRPGTNVDIEVVATRSLGRRSAQQTLKWQGAIRKPR